jgi:hypothetical protein
MQLPDWLKRIAALEKKLGVSNKPTKSKETDSAG